MALSPAPYPLKPAWGQEISCQDAHHFLSLLLASPRALIWGDFEPQLPRSQPRSNSHQTQAH